MGIGTFINLEAHIQGCFFIGCCTGANEDSPAPTVHASDGSGKKAGKDDGDKGGGAGSPPVVTPKPKIKRSDTAGTDESRPKLSRRVQSRELMRRSPTVHYSPGKHGKQPKIPKATAVKAKAKSSSAKKVTKNNGKPDPKDAIPKVEPPTPATASAVAQALHRSTTHQLQPQSPPRGESPSASASDAEGAKVAGQGPPGDDPPDDDPENGEHTLRQVQSRKAAHARYMRFSRSMKAKGFLSIIISAVRSCT